MSPIGFVVFVFFAVVQVGMYLAVRREWFSSGATIGGGIGVSVVLALLMAFVSGNSLSQALFVALLMGLLISGVTLAVAFYFHNAERRHS
jgi:hypothetical protein